MKDSFLIKKGRFTPFAVIAMILLPTVTGILCMCFGRMKLPVSDVIGSICSIFTGEIDNLQTYSVVVNLRLPRILMAIIVGAGLTCAGDTFQSLFSNPLATPDILGVTSGTCVGAILAIILSCGILEKISEYLSDDHVAWISVRGLQDTNLIGKLGKKFDISASVVQYSAA